MTLELRNVTKCVGAETHIHETSLTLMDHGFNILLGTTLSGKTTLMQLMAGLEQPTTGEVWFKGRNVTGVPVQKRNVAMVYQQFINYANFSVFENIASPLRVARLGSAEVAARVNEIADLLQLTPMLQRRPSELSGGQQQRTALARALVKDSGLVLLDEPLANLDFKLREELREQLPKLFADRACTVVYATTEPIEALLLGGHTAALHEGRVTQFGATCDIYRRPLDLLTAQVFSETPINTAEVRKSGDKVTLTSDIEWNVSGAQAQLPDGTYRIGIRPHHISPFASSQDRTEIRGKVIIAELSGSESTIRFSHQSLNWVSLSKGLHSFLLGEETAFYMSAGRCMYFNGDGKRVA